MTDSTALAKLNKAETALAKAEKLADISSIRSHARVFQTYVKEFRLGREAKLQGATVQILAELKAGIVANTMVGNKDYGLELEEARLSPGQVNRWKRAADSSEENFAKLKRKVEEYIQTIRENPDEVEPSLRGYWMWMQGKTCEEAQKEIRTEWAKQYLANMPFEEIEKVTKKVAGNPGIPKERRDSIKKAWQGILDQGNMLWGQKPCATQSK